MCACLFLCICAYSLRVCMYVRMFSSSLPSLFLSLIPFIFLSFVFLKPVYISVSYGSPTFMIHNKITKYLNFVNFVS
jgi:hypothetical protein